MSSFDESWEDLCNYINKWYYKADLMALRIILCTYLTHFYFTSPPVWLSVLGLPGSGKTELGINPLISLPSVCDPISEITTNSFLSGFGDKNGILDKLYPLNKNAGTTQGIILFPDFTTTLLSKDQYTRAEVMGQMRRVYDGAFEKKVGNKPEMMKWRGKATCIAAATPDIEEHWAMFRDMGERWLNLKWGNWNPTKADMYAMQDFAQMQEGHEDTIRKGLHKRIAKILKDCGSGPETTPKSKELGAIGILLEECRVNVKREYTGRGYQVSDKGNKQYNTRTAKSLSILCKASAALRCSSEFGQIDIDIAKRVAMDSIPTKRWKFIKTMIDIFPDTVKKDEFAQATGFSRSAFDRLIEDLRHLDIINVDTAKDTNDTEIDLFSGASTSDLLECKYNFRRPGADAILSLNPNIVDLLRDANLIKS